MSQWTAVTCSKCNKIFKVEISSELLEQVDKFPFPVVLMHITHDGDRNIHTLIAYSNSLY